MRTRQKRVATYPWRSLGCRTTPLEHWSRRKPTVEPRWAKQQTKKLRPKPTKINSFMSGPSLSDARPTGVQLKREAKLLTEPTSRNCHTGLPCYLSEQHRCMIHSQLCSLCNTKIHFLIPVVTVHCLQVWRMMRESAFRSPRI